MNVPMGLKSKLNKMKSFLFDEEDDEKEERRLSKRSLKKESKKTETAMETEDLSKTQEIEELYFEDVSEPKLDETKEIKSRALKNEQEFKFPEFDDDDFMVARTKKEPIISVKEEDSKPILYQGSKRKEEQKKFKPSPIISPIYGLLDKDGNRVKDTVAKQEKDKYNDEVSLDVVRKKAYGSLDEELENTMKRLSKKTIEEAEKDMEKEEKELSRAKEKAKKVKEQKPIVVLENQDDEEDDMILPNVNFKEIDVDKERTKELNEKIEEKEKIIDEEDDDDTKEQDLFNLIDSMYQKEERED